MGERVSRSGAEGADLLEPVEAAREAARLARALVPLIARIADGEEQEAERLLERLGRRLWSRSAAEQPSP